MKLRRILPALLCLLALCLCAPMVALADTGPKPSETIVFKGLKDRNCYVTLLSQKGTGPWQIYNGKNMTSVHSQKDLEIRQKFDNYMDNEGYRFIQFFGMVDVNDCFMWTYYPPDKFKILLYFPDSDTFAVSDGVYRQYAFKSCYIVDASRLDPAAGGTFSATRSSAILPWQKNEAGLNHMLALLGRMLLTLLIELSLAWLYGFRAIRQMLVIVATNIVTQLLLNFALYSAGVANLLYYLLLYFGLELGVFAIEAAVYALTLNRLRRLAQAGADPTPPISPRTCVGYAFAANIASFLAGLLLAMVFPKMF